MSGWIMIGLVAGYGLLGTVGLCVWAHYRPQDFAGDAAAGVQDLT